MDLLRDTAPKAQAVVEPDDTPTVIDKQEPEEDENTVEYTDEEFDLMVQQAIKIDK